MKKQKFIACALGFGLLFTPNLQAQSPDTVTYSGKLLDNPSPSGGVAFIQVGGQQRQTMVFRPSVEKNLPLLLFFKGTGNSVDISDNEFADFARQQKVIVLVPEQRELNFGDWDNHSEGTPYWETTNASRAINTTQNPDLNFVRALIKDAIATYQINPKRVYTAGFSSGAFFSYFVAMNLNDRIAAFSETSGGLACGTTGNPPESIFKGDDANRSGIVVQNSCAGISVAACSPASLRPIAPKNSPRKVPAYLFHNDDDNSVGVENTCRLADQLQKAGYSPSELSVNIRKLGGGHVATLAYLNGAWNFMKKFTLP